ncbi:MAG: hypothetical protein GXP55_07705, partial [Deltaproteobacteria bacterium]|nr:hypothetical protein [Deltaproteobacteria bacterium]
EGFLCDIPAGETTGTCRHYCCGGADTGCPLGQRCAVNLVDATGMQTGVGFCRLPDTCDLVAQTGCSRAGDGCYPSGGDGSVICVAAGTGTEGSACSAGNDCVAGFMCAGAAGEPGKCSKICDRDATPTTCASDQTCGGVTGFPANIGICTPPAGGG